MDYDNQIIVNGQPISSKTFFDSVTGQKYSHEAEERVLAKTKKFIDDNGLQDLEDDAELTGLDITGCIKGIMVNMMYKHMFEVNFTDRKQSNVLTGTVSKNIERVDKTVEALKYIASYSERTGIPIVFVNETTTTADILRGLSKHN